MRSSHSRPGLFQVAAAVVLLALAACAATPPARTTTADAAAVTPIADPTRIVVTQEDLKRTGHSYDPAAALRELVPEIR